jgi:hypothetical protein
VKEASIVRLSPSHASNFAEVIKPTGISRTTDSTLWLVRHPDRLSVTTTVYVSSVENEKVESAEPSGHLNIHFLSVCNAINPSVVPQAGFTMSVIFGLIANSTFTFAVSLHPFAEVPTTMNVPELEALYLLLSEPTFFPDLLH